MNELPDKATGVAIGALFRRALEAGEAAAFSLPGGAPLFTAGEPADQLFLLSAGRLAAVRHEADKAPHFLGLIRPGEPAGEMSLLSGEAHTASVVALRDSEILALPRDVFLRAARKDPALMLEMATLLLARVRQRPQSATLASPTVFGFMAVSDSLVARPLARQIAAAIERLGYLVKVVDADAGEKATGWLSNLEHLHDFILYVAEAGDDDAWRLLAGRQVDRLFRIARAGDPPDARSDPSCAVLQVQNLVDLILIQAPTCDRPRGSAGWSAALSPARLFHVREGCQADIERMARLVTGQAVGLVLSGGAARAYAHVGAVRALRERDIPIDFVAGVSMGAIVAAGVAMGWDDQEMDRRIRRAFVESSPVDDIAFPFIAMTRGERVRQRLAEHFGDLEICDLWLPFFCGSANLTTGVYQIHRHGLVRDALRASLSLPGVLPPTILDNDVLVDGAVMNNFPADIMRGVQPGPIIGVDVSRGRSIDADDIKRPPSLIRWLLSGDWRRGPPIVSLLMRAATVTTGRDLAVAREAADVLILPMVDMIEIRDWKAYEPAVAAGRGATLATLDRLDTPVTQMRRRPSIAPTMTPAMAAERQMD